MSCEDDPLDFGCFTKRPSDRWKVILDFGPTLSRYIEFGKLYRADEYILPRRSTGFAYKVLSDGTSGSREPIWPALSGAEVVSGSLRMITVPALYNAIDIVTDVSTTVTNVADEALISNVSISDITWEGPYVELFISGGDHLTDHLITVSASTQSGQIIAGVALCSVRRNKPQLCLCE